MFDPLNVWLAGNVDAIKYLLREGDQLMYSVGLLAEPTCGAASSPHVGKAGKSLWYEAVTSMQCV